MSNSRESNWNQRTRHERRSSTNDSARCYETSHQHRSRAPHHELDYLDERNSFLNTAPNVNNRIPRKRKTYGSRPTRTDSANSLPVNDTASRLKCVRFVVNHSKAMVEDDPEMFRRTISTIIDPLIVPDVGKPERVDLTVKDTVGIGCNGSGIDNHANSNGVARSARIGSGHDHSVSGRHTHACKTGRHSDGVISVQSNHSDVTNTGEDGIQYVEAVSNLPIRDHVIMTQEGKCFGVYLNWTMNIILYNLPVIVQPRLEYSHFRYDCERREASF